MDALVVGAGPAGAAAAFSMARRGLNVSLLDAAVFPRDKLCGGLLTKRTENIYTRLFGPGWEQRLEFTADGADFFDGPKLIQSFSAPSCLYLTSRLRFDDDLLRMAAREGARVLQRSRVVSVDRERSSVRCADGRELRADFIIGCDGANSRVAQAVGVHRNRARHAAGLEVHIPRDAFKTQITRPQVHFNVIRWGYAWIFPKRDHVTAGLAGLPSKTRNFRTSFSAFLEMMGCNADPARWKGHPVPFGNYVRRPGRGNLLLCGDAAGLVEPITGEGIAFALESGALAAEAVFQAAQQGAPERATALYAEQCRRIHKLFRQASWMRWLIFPETTQSIFLWALRRSPSVAAKYLQLMNDEIDYADYARFLAGKIVRAARPRGQGSLPSEPEA